MLLLAAAQLNDREVPRAALCCNSRDFLQNIALLDFLWALIAIALNCEINVYSVARFRDRP